jgi:hypothetical protein
MGGDFSTVRHAGTESELFRVCSGKTVWISPRPDLYGAIDIRPCRHLDMSNCRACDDIIANIAAENLSCGMIVKFRKIA